MAGFAVPSGSPRDRVGRQSLAEGGEIDIKQMLKGNHHPARVLFLCIAALAVWVGVLALPVALVLWTGLSMLWVAAGAVTFAALIWTVLLLFSKQSRFIMGQADELRPIPLR
jgi:hypothetical protein